MNDKTKPEAQAREDAVRDALRMAVRQNSHDMLMTGEEIRECEAALSAPASHDAQQRAITHCENCGCDWLDNGINPVGCPYCKQQPGADVDLPINDAVPAPTKIEPGNLFLWNWRAMQEYARTCVAAQQPAVVGDGVLNALRSYEQADADGTFVKVSRQALDEAIAALTPAATPGDYLHPGARVEWQDQVGRWWPVTIIRHRPESYDAELDDGCDALNYPRGRFRRIAAQKEGNGNG